VSKKGKKWDLRETKKGTLVGRVKFGAATRRRGNNHRTEDKGTPPTWGQRDGEGVAIGPIPGPENAHEEKGEAAWGDVESKSN